MQFNIKPHFVLAVIATVAAASLIVFAKNAAYSTEGREKNVHLVKARFISKEVISGRTIANFTVNHVYHGDSQLEGMNFASRVNEGRGDSIGASIRQTPKEQEEGIWALRKNQANIFPIFQVFFGKKWPSRMGVDLRYAQAMKLAEAVESVSLNETESPMVDRLVEYALGDVPEISRWATTSILQLGERGKKILFQGNAPRNDLPVMAKIALDKFLVKENDEFWTTSEDRHELLFTLASSNMKPIEATALVQRLDLIAQHNLLPIDDLVEIIHIVINNVQFSAKERQHCLGILGRIVNTSNNSAAVAELVEQIEGSDQQMALMAAYALRNSTKRDDWPQAYLEKVKENKKGSIADWPWARLEEIKENKKGSKVAEVLEKILKERVTEED